jgi:hypothetical protein
MSWLSEVFQLNPAGLNWNRGVVVLDVLLVPLVFYWAIGHEEYLLSSLFGVLVAGLLLNIWFIIAIAIAAGFHNSQHPHITSNTWTQVGAWAAGVALWIVLTFLGWLIRGRTDAPAFIAEMPGDTSSRPLTRPVIMFAGVAIAVVVMLKFSQGRPSPVRSSYARTPALTVVKKFAGPISPVNPVVSKTPRTMTLARATVSVIPDSASSDLSSRRVCTAVESTYVIASALSMTQRAGGSAAATACLTRLRKYGQLGKYSAASHRYTTSPGTVSAAGNASMSW